MGVQRRDPSNVRPEYRFPPVKPAAAPRRRAKRWPWIAGAVAVLSVWAAYEAHRSLVPHFGRASRDEIVAAIPADLRTPERRDPAAEARFVRFAHLLHETFEREDADWEAYEKASRKEFGMTKVVPPRYTKAQLQDYDRRRVALIPKAQALLAEGNLLATDGVSIRHWWRAVLPRDHMLEAARRADYKTCVEDALWRIRLARAVADAGAIDDRLPSPTSPEMSDDVETIYSVEMAGGYDGPGREQILAALVPRDDRGLLAAKVRRYFEKVLVPQVVEVASGGDYWKVRGLYEPSGLRSGTFDPIETVSLMADGIHASLADLQSPDGHRKRADAFSLKARARFKGFPPKAGGNGESVSYLDDLRWRVAMNRCPNSLGAEWATSAMPSLDSPYYGPPPNEVELLLVRSVLLLRQGRTDLPRDPFGVGPLRFDPIRKLVWSVGVDGIDGKARIVERFGSPSGPPRDIVYRY